MPVIEVKATFVNGKLIKEEILEVSPMSMDEYSDRLCFAVTGMGYEALAKDFLNWINKQKH